MVGTQNGQILRSVQRHVVAAQNFGLETAAILSHSSAGSIAR